MWNVSSSSKAGRRCPTAVAHATTLLTLLLGLLLPGSAAAQIAPQDIPNTCRNHYTQQQEIQLGDKVVQQVYQTMPVLPDSDPVAQYVRRLGAQLVAAAPLTPGLERQWPFNIHVVASSEINAFALPGGSMFVNLGAIQAAETEAQLAGVMAHEMSHVLLRHSTCNMVKKQNRSILYSLGQIGAAIALGGAAGDLASQGIGAAQGLDFLHMSRGDEEQADKLGVRILHNAGIDPRGLPQFFEIIIAKSGSGPAQFLSDHPNPGNRMEYLRQEIATLPPLEHPIVTTAAFKEAHAEAAQAHALTATEMQSGQWKSSGLYARGPGAAVTATPVSGTAPNTSSGTPLRVSPLSAGQLGLSARLVRYQGALFAIDRPASWTASQAGSAGASGRSSVTLAPPGAAGDFGVAYGVILAVQHVEGQGVSDADSLVHATGSFAQQFAQSHGLTAEGAPTATSVGGQPAVTQYLTGASPVNGGAERDWLVTVARPDGDMDTLLFVAPAAQQSSMQPLFNRMLATFSPQ